MRNSVISYCHYNGQQLAGMDDDMSRKQFVKIVLPAGLTDPSEVQIRITEDMEHRELKTTLLNS